MVETPWKRRPKDHTPDPFPSGQQQQTSPAAARKEAEKFVDELCAGSLSSGSYGNYWTPMWEFPKIGVPYFGLLLIRILLNSHVNPVIRR